jgi:hypothetical protein
MLYQRARCCVIQKNRKEFFYFLILDEQKMATDTYKAVKEIGGVINNDKKWTLRKLLYDENNEDNNNQGKKDDSDDMLLQSDTDPIGGIHEFIFQKLKLPDNCPQNITNALLAVKDDKGTTVFLKMFLHYQYVVRLWLYGINQGLVEIQKKNKKILNKESHIYYPKFTASDYASNFIRDSNFNVCWIKDNEYVEIMEDVQNLIEFGLFFKTCFEVNGIKTFIQRMCERQAYFLALCDNNLLQRIPTEIGEFLLTFYVRNFAKATFSLHDADHYTVWLGFLTKAALFWNDPEQPRLYGSNERPTTDEESVWYETEFDIIECLNNLKKYNVLCVYMRCFFEKMLKDANKQLDEQNFTLFDVAVWKYNFSFTTPPENNGNSILTINIDDNPRPGERLGKLAQIIIDCAKVENGESKVTIKVIDLRDPKENSKICSLQVKHKLTHKCIIAYEAKTLYVRIDSNIQVAIIKINLEKYVNNVTVPFVFATQAQNATIGDQPILDMDPYDKEVDDATKQYFYQKTRLNYLIEIYTSYDQDKIFDVLDLSLAVLLDRGFLWDGEHVSVDFLNCQLVTNDNKQWKIAHYSEGVPLPTPLASNPIYLLYKIQKMFEELYSSVTSTLKHALKPETKVVYIPKMRHLFVLNTGLFEEKINKDKVTIHDIYKLIRSSDKQINQSMKLISLFGQLRNWNPWIVKNESNLFINCNETFLIDLSVFGRQYLKRMNKALDQFSMKVTEIMVRQSLYGAIDDNMSPHTYISNNKDVQIEFIGFTRDSKKELWKKELSSKTDIIQQTVNDLNDENRKNLIRQWEKFKFFPTPYLWCYAYKHLHKKEGMQSALDKKFDRKNGLNEIDTEMLRIWCYHKTGLNKLFGETLSGHLFAAEYMSADEVGDVHTKLTASQKSQKMKTYSSKKNNKVYENIAELKEKNYDLFLAAMSVVYDQLRFDSMSLPGFALNTETFATILDKNPVLDSVAIDEYYEMLKGYVEEKRTAFHSLEKKNQMQDIQDRLEYDLLVLTRMTGSFVLEFAMRWFCKQKKYTSVLELIKYLADNITKYDSMPKAKLMLTELNLEHTCACDIFDMKPKRNADGASSSSMDVATSSSNSGGNIMTGDKQTNKELNTLFSKMNIKPIPDIEDGLMMFLAQLFPLKEIKSYEQNQKSDESPDLFSDPFFDNDNVIIAPQIDKSVVAKIPAEVPRMWTNKYKYENNILYTFPEEVNEQLYHKVLTFGCAIGIFSIVRSLKLALFESHVWRLKQMTSTVCTKTKHTTLNQAITPEIQQLKQLKEAFENSADFGVIKVVKDEIIAVMMDRFFILLGVIQSRHRFIADKRYVRVAEGDKDIVCFAKRDMTNLKVNINPAVSIFSDDFVTYDQNTIESNTLEKYKSTKYQFVCSTNLSTNLDVKMPGSAAIINCGLVSLQDDAIKQNNNETTNDKIDVDTSKLEYDENSATFDSFLSLNVPHNMEIDAPPDKFKYAELHDYWVIEQCFSSSQAAMIIPNAEEKVHMDSDDEDINADDKNEKELLVYSAFKHKNKGNDEEKYAIPDDIKNLVSDNESDMQDNLSLNSVDIDKADPNISDNLQMDVDNSKNPETKKRRIIESDDDKPATNNNKKMKFTTTNSHPKKNLMASTVLNQKMKRIKRFARKPRGKIYDDDDDDDDDDDKKIELQKSRDSKRKMAHPVLLAYNNFDEAVEERADCFENITLNQLWTTSWSYVNDSAFDMLTQTYDQNTIQTLREGKKSEYDVIYNEYMRFIKDHKNKNVNSDNDDDDDDVKDSNNDDDDDDDDKDSSDDDDEANAEFANSEIGKYVTNMGEIPMNNNVIQEKPFTRNNISTHDYRINLLRCAFVKAFNIPMEKWGEMSNLYHIYGFYFQTAQLTTADLSFPIEYAQDLTFLFMPDASCGDARKEHVTEIK